VIDRLGGTWRTYTEDIRFGKYSEIITDDNCLPFYSVQEQDLCVQQSLFSLLPLRNHRQEKNATRQLLESL
jgi:hypothetical protein